MGSDLLLVHAPGATPDDALAGWHLAAVCRSKGDDRRTDQQIEDSQASDVWPRRSRLALRSDDTVVGRQLAPRVNQTPPRWLPTDVAAGCYDGVGLKLVSSTVPQCVTEGLREKSPLLATRTIVSHSRHAIVSRGVSRTPSARGLYHLP